jgi:hypothetical protein
MSNSYILPLKLHQLKKFSTCAIGSESSIDYCMQTAVNYTLQLFYLVSFARTSKSVNNMEFRFALLFQCFSLLGKWNKPDSVLQRQSGPRRGDRSPATATAPGSQEK